MPTKRTSQPILSHRERAERQAQQARRRRTRILLFVAAGVLGLAAIIAAIVLLSGGGDPGPGVAVPLAGSQHVPVGTQIRYDRFPPSSGTHYGETVPYGVREETTPEGFWVHNLEHGAIVVLYNCSDGCPDLVTELRDAYNTFPPSRNFGKVKLTVLPYPRLESRLAYLAWGWEYITDTYQRDDLFRFYQAHLDKGPELVP